MKKTLITLAALAMASVASAAMDSSYLTVPVAADDNSYYAGAFTFQFCINDAGDVAYNTGTALAYYIGGYDGDYAGNKFTLYRNGDDSFTLTVGQTHLSTLNTTNAFGYYTFFSDLKSGVVYTFTHEGELVDNKVTVTLTGTGYNKTSSYDARMNGDHVAFTTAFNTSFIPVTTGGGESVPEPATATLSLLALAGLAARRRRK